MALVARDAGCSFPGCTQPASRCDRHHIVDWILGGLTDLDNLTLLCRHHSHFLQKGCSCRLNADRLPEWTPPRWIDQDQRPQVNARIRRLRAQRQLESRGGHLSPHESLELVPSRLFSFAVNSETSGSAMPFTALIGTAPLRLLVQKAPRDSRRSWIEQRQIATGVR